MSHRPIQETLSQPAPLVPGRSPSRTVSANDAAYRWSASSSRSRDDSRSAKADSTPALPKTKLESLHPSTRFNGTVTVADRRVDVHDWPGTIGHNWGTQHAERWVWLHAAGFDGHALDTWIDAAIARVRVGPLVSPWVANGALSIDGVRYRLGGIGRRSRRIHAIRPPLGVQGPIGAVLPPNPAMMRSAFSRASRAPSGSPPASSAADKPASARPRSYGPP